MTVSKALALGAGVCVLMTGVASAATWQVLATVSSAIDRNTGNPTPGFSPTGTPSLNVTVPNYLGINQYKVDFYTSFANPATGTRGYGNIDWSLNPTGGLDAFDQTSTWTQGDGWQADSSNIDTNGGSHTSGLAALWSTNLDFGSNTDLQNIICSLAVIASPNSNDPRPYVGRVLPNATVEGDVTGVANSRQWQWNQTTNRTYLGSLFVDWNGTSQENLTAVLNQSSYSMPDGTLLQDKGTAWQGMGGNFDTPRVLQAVAITFQAAVVPEPSSLVLLMAALPVLAFAARRRRFETRTTGFDGCKVPRGPT